MIIRGFLTSSFLLLTFLLQLRVRPVAELPGDVSLRLALRKLDSIGTFMETTAHPDDEDNGLLAWMSHGRGMRTTLVTATRGDGGQNEIGPEMFQALGVLRTEELLAVHRFDGAEQYFTRAIDFGYSFSVEESIDKWGHDEILGDFVRHIRTIRPDVIAGFVCGGGGGGQHHQASTRLTLEAFRAAADPSRYPEQIAAGLRPWQARRVFCTEGFVAPGQPPVAAAPDLLRVSPSEFDPVIGRTFSELGLEARSMHKCQGTSQLLLLPGASQTRIYRLKDSVIGDPGVAPKDMFDGIDTTLAGLAAYAGTTPPAALASSLKSIAEAVAAATTAVQTGGPADATAPLVSGLAGVRRLRGQLAAMGLADGARYEIDFRLAQKERQFEDALILTHGIRVEALAPDGTVVAGQPLRISTVAGNNGPADVSLKSVSFAGFAGTAAACAGAIGTRGAVSCTADLRVGEAKPSTPYWQPRKDAARYDFEPDAPFGLPFRPTPFRATFTLTIGGADVTVERAVEFRYSDLFAGEKRMELQVVPAINVRVAPDIAVIPAASMTVARAASGGAASRGSRARTIEVTMTSNQPGTVKGTLGVEVPPGWQATPPQPFQFDAQDTAITERFVVTPAATVAPGEYAVTAVATIDGNAARQSLGYEVVEYPHIHRRHVVEAARTRVKVIDVKVAPGLRVGYIMGVGDAVPEAIEQLGAEVHRIDAAELASGDLSRYDVIMTGVRAYERRADLRANNGRLLKYVEDGGTVIVQYSRQEFNQAQYGPFPAKTGSDRITDENAPIEILVPGHPVFNRPNVIGPEAWAGWVQERGTYFLADRDPRYVDLIRSTDPFPLNAGAKTGALVEAKYGKGRWLYTGLGLWRQLPAGTDGAYRLLANLISLGKT